MTEYKGFEDMELDKNLLHGIYSYGFEKPSHIQQRGIMPIKEGKDVIAQSQSGTGKTGTFSIGLLSRINLEDKSTQVIVISPTRELAKQNCKVITSLSQYMNLNIKDMIGGGGVGRLRSQMDAQIIVGTPGKILDELGRKKIDISKLKILVLDEADEMLSKGFREQLRQIVNFLAANVQICLFSATMPEEVLELSAKITHDPYKILMNAHDLTLEGIRQYYVLLDHENMKMDVIADIYGNISITQSIIYCNSKKRTSILAHKMNIMNFCVTCVHGDMSQSERDKSLESFRNGNARVLIATDVLARGIDIQQVSLVINYDLTNDIETYIHRIGRSGRYGRKGMSINLITKYEVELMKKIENFYSTHIESLPANFGDYI